MKIRSFRFLAALLLVACASLEGHAEPMVQARDHQEVAIPVQIVPPGKDGEPLPAQDKSIAQHWPVEFREFIERVEKFFSTPWPRYFTEQEIAEALQMKLVPAPERVSPESGVAEEYWITGVPFVRLHVKGVISATETYVVMKPDIYPGTGKFQTVMMHFPIETRKFCINPYDFSIYSGAKASVPLPIHPPPNYVSRGFRYEWGMFEVARGFSLSASDLIGGGYSIGVKGQCISSLRVSGTRDLGLKK